MAIKGALVKHYENIAPENQVTVRLKETSRRWLIPGTEVLEAETKIIKEKVCICIFAACALKWRKVLVLTDRHRDCGDAGPGERPFAAKIMYHEEKDTKKHGRLIFRNWSQKTSLSSRKLCEQKQVIPILIHSTIPYIRAVTHTGISKLGGRFFVFFLIAKSIFVYVCVIVLQHRESIPFGIWLCPVFFFAIIVNLSFPINEL